MELNITDFFYGADHSSYSASALEAGPNVGKLTWDNAVQDAPEYNLLDNPTKLQAFREYIRSFGAWSDDEIEGFSSDELTALLMQCISADIREIPDVPSDTNEWTEEDWQYVEEMWQEGIISGRIYKPDSVYSDVYYYIGE